MINTSDDIHLVILRLSALGDILATIPVIHTLADNYPNYKITVISHPLVESVFHFLPQNVHFVPLNTRNYKGIRGVFAMRNIILKLQPTHIADLHYVLRSRLLTLGMPLRGIALAHIVKDRVARKDFIRSSHKELQISCFERYEETFHKLGFSVRKSNGKPFFLFAEEHLQGRNIGIAPFAAHQGKIYPLELMENLIRLLLNHGFNIFLFGGGKKELDQMENWENRYDAVHTVAGNYPSLADQAKLMSQLDAIITMDSGNMHLAALTRTPVISIWGATHPKGGFLAWNCTGENVVQCSDLACRPCSIYGQTPCKYGDYRCLQRIPAEIILDKVLQFCHKS